MRSPNPNRKRNEGGTIKDKPPSSRAHRTCTVKNHGKAHRTVVRNEFWFGDGFPVLGKQFTAANAANRGQAVIKILERAARTEKRAKNASRAGDYRDLAKKLKKCRTHARCGSLACPMCARAFQKAKVAAEERLIRRLHKSKLGKKLVMVTVVPLGATYKPEELKNLDIRKKNRWLKDVLRKEGFNRIMFGSADISWEDSCYYQLHWHLAMWTRKPRRLATRLKRIFLGKDPYDRPVVVTTTRDIDFLGYMNKVIKLPDLLRRSRHQLPELLLALDRTEPLNVLFLMNLRLSTEKAGLELKPIKRRKTKPNLPRTGYDRSSSTSYLNGELSRQFS